MEVAYGGVSDLTKSAKRATSNYTWGFPSPPILKHGHILAPFDAVCAPGLQGREKTSQRGNVCNELYVNELRAVSSSSLSALSYYGTTA